MIRAMLLLVPLLLFAAPAEADVDYVATGQRSWAAFRCAALADFGVTDDEHMVRLFQSAMTNGRVFIEAYRGALIPTDSAHELPQHLIIHEGSVDFVLGYAWAQVRQEIMSQVTGTGFEMVGWMAREFRKRHCVLLD